MSNLFDRLKKNVFNAIATQMGYDASWEGKKARILLNCPSQEEREAEHFYDFGRVKMEYKESDWPGLKELIEEKQLQTITIEEAEYKTLKIIADSSRAQDGGVYTVSLQKI